MDISSGGFFGLLRILFKPVGDYFGMLFFYRAYDLSTICHNHRETFAMRPNELVRGVEYRILWKPYHHRKKQVTPMVWLKSKHNESFSKIVLTVTAANEKIKYQDHVTMYDISEVPTQTALPSIPFRNLKFKGNTVFTPYDSIKTVVESLHDAQGERISLRYPSEKYIHPFDRLEVAMGLQKGDVEKWGEVFNLEFIEMELREEKIRLIGPMFGHLKPIYYLRKKLFSIGWVVKTIFWAKNIIFAKQLETKFIKYLEDYEKNKNREKIINEKCQKMPNNAN